MNVEDLLARARPRLVRALLAVRGIDGAEEAAAEAIAWGWEHQARLAEFDDPVAYLYRVAQTRSVTRRKPDLPPADPVRMPEVEPQLVPALLDLPLRQRAAVWLVHGCGWRHREVAVALDISTSTVSTHVERGLEKLRQDLGATKGSRS